MHSADDSDLTGRVIGCAIEVHHHLGPGLLESIYETALCHELSQAGIGFVRQRRIRAKYQGLDLDCGSRVLAIEAVAQLLPIHEGQLLTSSRISGPPLGLLLNFNEVRLKDGIRRRLGP